MAEVLAIATVLGGLSAVWFFWDKLTAFWNRRVAARVARTVGGLEPRRADSIEQLRDQLKAEGVHEHVADDQTVALTAYPTLLEVTGRPSFELGEPAMRLFRGQSLDLVLKDEVLGIGFYYKQGLYPSNFNIYFKGGRQEAFVGSGYFPELRFFGLSSSFPIQRVIVQTQADGNVAIVGVHIFARTIHSRSFASKKAV